LEFEAPHHVQSMEQHELHRVAYIGAAVKGLADKD